MNEEGGFIAKGLAVNIGPCLVRPLGTLALDSTGFRTLLRHGVFLGKGMWDEISAHIGKDLNAQGGVVRLLRYAARLGNVEVIKKEDVPI